MIVDAAAIEAGRVSAEELLAVWERVDQLQVVDLKVGYEGLSERIASRLTSPLPRYARMWKRSVDIIVAAGALLLASPLLVATALAIRLTSPGPALFRQTRVGQGGRFFTIRKLRTMRADAESSRHAAYVAALIGGTAERNGSMYKLTHDPRITAVGRVLRRSSLDELPQLWNILVGDMSLVGPRPPLAREVVLYDSVAWHRIRVKPGLTGLWQVNGRCELTFAEMIRLDNLYWQSWSPALELSILLRTPAAVLSGKGAA